MSSTMGSTIQEFITSLAGRYDQLNDSDTISGESSRRFNTYVYSRKLLIRKCLEDSGFMESLLKCLYKLTNIQGII